ncbi:hypothetical protein D9611_009468 [Ephemerocybe angulata]|uniref:DUF6699 domain-containing protein n=1 Tax=Ephemerocybe angulata TaxID=980116 RepID=A0A8H5AV24_9AGAR|nr:hypothetical protein D9611_009468 [Tulosesus angulatus]
MLNAWKSSDRPVAPKLGTVALPETFSPARGAHHRSASEHRPSKISSWRNRFRSSNSESQPRAATPEVPLAEALRRARGLSDATTATSDDDDDDDDRVVYRASRHQRGVPVETKLDPSKVSSREEWEREKWKKDQRAQEKSWRFQQELAKMGHNGTLQKSKAAKEVEQEWEEEIDHIEALKREAQRHPTARITLVKSKAAIEEEQEREEEQRKLDEMKKAEQRKFAASRATPLKSCLKPSPPSQPNLGFSTPSPQIQGYNNSPSYVHPQVEMRRRESVNYYSDTEGYRPAYRSRRSNTYHAAPPQAPPAQPPHPQRADSYPADAPYHGQPYAHPGQRSRNQSFSGPPQPAQVTPPGHMSNYKKAYVKPSTRPVVPWVPNHEETVLSWPLTDPNDQRHVAPGMGAIFFDAAFDPRVQEFEIQVMRFGERCRSPLTRAEEKMYVCPSAHMPQMVLYNEKLAQWPVVVNATKGNCRVIDVFRAIYDTYSVPLTRDELLQIGQSTVERCQRAFRQRCNDTPGLPPVTEAKGLCRIDLLRGERIFKGLTPLTGSQYPVNSWQLHFEKITR